MSGSGVSRGSGPALDAELDELEGSKEEYHIQCDLTIFGGGKWVCVRYDRLFSMRVRCFLHHRVVSLSCK
ncbi:unnamed protein product [Tuber melanosporum]|uniref:(Perigord truffle) hypothetical protein n=1 Tax=Tuber melanosporum (strain Mel28) TaxID=656061 RepID=D5G7U1_TUBMM|nr:uncharacterized protein GSTUM_00004723001 [Tuber melanosporum]CAZ80584.1 unnamed protein product [Tuber melanosporum]